MTANEDELTQQIASILDKPSVYMGGPSRRSLRMAGEIVDLLRSRASIGPDSERIRELEAENAELRRRLAASQSSPEWTMVRCPTCGQIAPPHSHRNLVMP
jgi:alkanesulfonate monooxygenase SsuD/methylene tetrahydromethanopterin reductase-like flavin-dependent oxidoreductase (luciferase family)